MLEDLKIKALNANLKLYKAGLHSFGYGNISLIDRESGLIVARPSGKDYLSLSCDDMLVFDLTGECIEGVGVPSAEFYTHLQLYRNLDDLDAVAFVRPTFTTAFAQAGKDITFYGSLHADFFCGDIPCVSPYQYDSDEFSFEEATAQSVVDIVKSMTERSMPAILVQSLGAFVMGNDVSHLLRTVEALEETAHLAYLTQQLNPGVESPDASMLESRFYSNVNNKNNGD